MKRKIKNTLFKLFLMSSVNERFKRTPPVFESIVSADPQKLFIIVLAFNHPELIQLNAAALGKFIQDKFQYFVMDNSSDNGAAEQIKQYCLARHVNYVRLPKNPGPDPSINSGMAFNWTFHNLINRYKPERFGFIDSDLFPTEPVNIGSYLDQGDAWGVITDRKPTFLKPFRRTVWYLWLGLFFFRREHFAGGELDFLPGEHGIDAGGRVPIDPDVIRKLPDVHRLQDPELLEIAPNITVHRYGKFVHFVGASYLPNALAEKIRWMENILKNN